MDQIKETCIKSGDNTDDGDDNVSLVLRPNPVERGVDRLDHGGDVLGRQRRAEDDAGGAEYKDDRRDPEQEPVFQGAE